MRVSPEIHFRGLGLESMYIGEVELQLGVNLGQDDLRGDVASRVTAHAIGKHNKARLGPYREITGDRIFLIIPRALADAGRDVISRLTRSPYHARLHRLPTATS